MDEKFPELEGCGGTTSHNEACVVFDIFLKSMGKNDQYLDIILGLTVYVVI